MVKPILPPVRITPDCPYCFSLMRDAHNGFERVYACACGHAMHADTYDQAFEAMALTIDAGVSFGEAWEMVAPLLDYAALWDARAAIQRRAAAA